MKRLLAFCFLVVILFSQCKQEGCTDNRAWNFCYDCKKDNGSCVYYGSAAFWINKSTYDSLVKYGHYNIELWVNGEFKTSHSFSTVFLDNYPSSCESGGVLRWAEELRNKSTTKMHYDIKNYQTKNNIWSGDVDLNIDNCSIVQLVWKP